MGSLDSQSVLQSGIMSKKILTEEQKLNKAEYARFWRKSNPEATALHAKATRLKHKDKVLERQRKWTKNNPDKVKENALKYYLREKSNIREKQLLKNFGISLAEYKIMLSIQNGVCAICFGGPDAKGKVLAVDHCHITGKIRGLLCRGCNVGIGNLKDSIQLMQRTIEYLTNKEQS